MTVAWEDRRLTVEEYLAGENDGRVRHEYVDGRAYAMTGGSMAHSQLSLRLASWLVDRAAADGCRAHNGDMKLRVGSAFYYPDVMVACGDPVDDYYEVAACLVVEVLSPSTEATDRREKVPAYRTIPAVQVVVLVRADRPGLEVHRRAPDGWTVTEHGPGERVAFDCPPVTLVVDELYAGLV